MNQQKNQWFKLALQLKGSVIPSIFTQTLFCAGFGGLISILYLFRVPVSIPILGSIIPSIVLGLLLVFRTNTAYERFWEGRKSWGGIIISIRNLSRQIWVSIDELEPKDRNEKIDALRLLVAFAIAAKLFLRSEPDNELKNWVSPEQYDKLETLSNPTLEIAFWIGDYMQKQYESNRLNSYQLTAMQQLLDDMVAAVTACERIRNTPMPLAYAIHLKQLLLIYCLLLPFQMVKDLGLLTAPVVGLVSFTLLGIEAIGLEIENPFGRDANDLPLDAICDGIRRYIEELITLPPTVRYWKKKLVE